jgi:protein arginine kinase
MRQVLRAARDAGTGLHIHKGITNAEREHLVGCRLISPDFKWNEPGRALLLDDARAISAMVNEEDHLRLQALTSGWSVQRAETIADEQLRSLGQHLTFAHSPQFGFLAASPYNTGHGTRLSAMFHLIGLAQTRRLPNVLRALADKTITARGLFGESSRAVGAFVQVSVTGGTRSEFVGACEYLIREERTARLAIGSPELSEKVGQAMDYAISARSLSLADALRVLAWLRWGASQDLPSLRMEPRQVDEMLTTFEVRSLLNPEEAGRHRASFLRAALEKR